MHFMVCRKLCRLVHRPLFDYLAANGRQSLVLDHQFSVIWYMILAQNAKLRNTERFFVLWSSLWIFTRWTDWLWHLKTAAEKFGLFNSVVLYGHIFGKFWADFTKGHEIRCREWAHFEKSPSRFSFNLLGFLVHLRTFPVSLKFRNFGPLNFFPFLCPVSQTT